MHEMRGEPEPTLEEQIARMSPCDLLLIEGYKYYPLPKLEIYRAANGKPLLYPEDEHIVALRPTCRSRRPCRSSASRTTIESPLSCLTRSELKR